jgi:hypothetical protein
MQGSPGMKLISMKIKIVTPIMVKKSEMERRRINRIKPQPHFKKPARIRKFMTLAGRY